MPIYEYRCDACGYEDEYLQKMSDAPLTVCPECGKAAFTKLMSAAGFHLKGSGWYVTDFKNPPKKGAEKKSDDKSTAKAEDKAEAKAEGKSEAKAEGKSEVKSEDKSAQQSSDKPADTSARKSDDTAASTKPKSPTSTSTT